MNENITADEIEAALKQEHESKRVECDTCGARIYPDLVATVIPGGFEYQRFTCPYCKTEYPVATITPYGLRLRDEIEALEKLENERHSQRLADARKKFSREVRKRQRPEVAQ